MTNIVLIYFVAAMFLFLREANDKNTLAAVKDMVIVLSLPVTKFIDSCVGCAQAVWNAFRSVFK